MNDIAQQSLQEAGIPHDVFWAERGVTVYISAAQQLFGEYRVFKAFRKAHPAYRGWHAHHVLEWQDVERLSCETIAPEYEQQTCVLLPVKGHLGRINSRLRTLLPIGAKSLTDEDVLEAYEDAYSILGNYCGSSERAIAEELMAIVRASLSR